MRAIRRVLPLAMLVISAACSSATAEGGSARPRGRSDLITHEEIQQRSGYSNLYDLIRDMRPRWLQTRGPDTLIGQQGEVQVHMDGNRMGGAAALRNLSPSGVTSIEWVAPVDAAGRYGLDHGHGAIVISTRPIR